MMIANKLEKFRLHFPFEVEDGKNTVVVDHDTEGVITFDIPPGVYQGDNYDSDSDRLIDEFISQLNTETGDSYGVGLTDDWARGEYSADSDDDEVTFLFDDADWTLPTKYLGWAEDDPNPTLQPDDTLVSRKTVFGIYELQNNHATIKDFRIWPSQTVYRSDDGPDPTSNAFGQQMMVDIQVDYVKTPLVYHHGARNKSAVEQVYGSLLYEGNEPNTLETVWSHAPTWADFDEPSQFCWLELYFDGQTDPTQKLKFVWDDENQISDFSQVVEDSEAPGETYDITINLKTLGSEVDR